jgi:hypothetical protein
LRTVSSRQEEKEQRKRERQERELAAAKEAKRKRLLQIIGGVVVGAVVVVGVVLAIAGGGGSNKRDDTKLLAAAKSAGCTVRSFPDYGREHTDGTQKLTAANYKTNPPTSGKHDPTPAQDGVYAAGNEAEIQNWVHTLEHGRILFQYKPGTSTRDIGLLQKLYNEPVLDSGNGYHSMLMQNNSNMPFKVAAVAWRHFVGCSAITPGSIEAMRLFREVYVDQAPEKVT